MRWGVPGSGLWELSRHPRGCCHCKQAKTAKQQSGGRHASRIIALARTNCHRRCTRPGKALAAQKICGVVGLSLTHLALVLCPGC